MEENSTHATKLRTGTWALGESIGQITRRHIPEDSIFIITGKRLSNHETISMFSTANARLGTLEKLKTEFILNNI
jgi:hypothetical protein